MGAAYMLNREDDFNSLKRDKLADLIVLEKDITRALPEQIHSVPVQLTMMNGKVVFDNLPEPLSTKKRCTAN